MKSITAKTPHNQQGLEQLRRLAKLMDAQFRIPGTDIRFGLDGLVGLIPGAGDMATFAVSGYMLWMMATKGASGFLLARMVLNIVIDLLLGSIPFIGDIFDVAFKANMRNMKLMEQHYVEGRHKGSAWKVTIPVLIILFALLILIIWATYKFFVWLF